MAKVTLLDLYNHCRLKRNRIHKEFRMADWNDGDLIPGSKVPDCRTAGCLAGELPALDPDWRFRDTNLVWEPWGHVPHPLLEGAKPIVVSLAEYFNISHPAVRHLFLPYWQLPASYGGVKLTNNSTLKEVLHNLKVFINLQKDLEDSK